MKLYRYAGIGARKTPKDMLAVMRTIGKINAKAGRKLLTGAAEGADDAFMQGHREVTDNNLEAFIPWNGYEGYSQFKQSFVHAEITQEALNMASEIYDRDWTLINQGVANLMARNMYQILGKDLNDPVDAVICWYS